MSRTELVDESVREAIPYKSRDESEMFDDAMCDFAVEHADQAQRDHLVFVKAGRQGRIKAVLDA